MLDTCPSKIGYVVKRYPRFSETFIVNEILAHERAGAEVEIFSLRPSSDTHFQDCISRVRAPVHYLASEKVRGDDLWSALRSIARSDTSAWQRLGEFATGEAQLVYQALELRRLVRSRGIGHLHAHFATSATDVALMAGALAQTPVTFTAHAKDIFHEDVCPQQFRWRLEQSQGVITVSDFNLSYLREEYGPSAGRVTRLYNGLDVDRFPFSNPGLRPPRIVAVGRLVEKKGFAYLLEACRTLRNHGVDFECHIIGTGECESALRQQATELQLDDCVSFRGALPQSVVIEEVTEAALMAAPCVVGNDGNRDGLPTVLLEAMALGTPCVATRVTGIPEIIRHEETGLLIDERDPAALAVAMMRLLTAPDLRVRLAVAARQLLEHYFDIDHNAAIQRRFFMESSQLRSSYQEAC